MENIDGDWHEFESKALRRDKEARRRAEYNREKEKRKAIVAGDQREGKKVKPDESEQMQGL